MNLKHVIREFFRIFSLIWKRNFSISRAELQNSARTGLKDFSRFFKTYSDFDLILFFVGVFALFTGISIYQYSEESHDWPSTEGRVVFVNVTAHHSGGGRDLTTGGIQASRTSYEPRIIYEFTVVGKQYKSQKRTFGSEVFDSRRQAEDIASGYREGQSVTVYYNPENPGLSVIELSEPDTFSPRIVIGVVFSGLSLILILTAAVNRLRKLLHEPGCSL